MKPFVIGILSLLLISCNERDERDVSVGQVWIYPAELGNPFDVPQHDTIEYNTVLELKNGWVKYKTRDGEIFADSVSHFKEGSSCIKR